MSWANRIETGSIRPPLGIRKLMFSPLLSDMPEAEREKEQNRMKEYKDKFQATLSQIKDTKSKFGIK